MREFFLLFLICLFSRVLTSCDPIHDAQIVNETEKEIILKVTFTEEACPDGKRELVLKNFPGFEHIKPFELDTLTRTVSFKIGPFDQFPLHYEIATDPEYSRFKQILILTPDTLLLKGEKEIGEAFEQISERHWELLINN
ncbi:MAG: hypothetical protein R2799_04790 [Crocinitomicaceae bacterium]